jgi:hypothetical protein
MRYLALVVICLSGCAKDGASPSANPAIVDPEGVPVVTSDTPLWPAGGGWQVDSVPITIIGADESDPQQQWVWVEAAARLPNGNVVIGTMGELRLFGADGKFIKVISRSGDGPGELRQVGALFVLPADSLRASDYMGARVATYAPDVTLVRNERLDMQKFQALGRWTECESGLLPDGSRYGCQPDSTIARSATNRPSVVNDNGMSSPGPGLLRQLRRVVVASPDLSKAFPLGLTGGAEQYGVSLDGGEAFVVHPFHSRVSIAAGGTPMRIAIALNPEYRIEMWTPTGLLERIIRREGARRAPTTAETAAARDGMLPYLPGMDSALQQKIIAEVPIPDSLPAVAGMAMTPAGELLVQREGNLRSHLMSVWDVFDVEGRWLGEISLPGTARILAAGTDFLLVRRFIETDQTQVEVYRVHRSSH